MATKTTFPKIRWTHEWVAVDLGNNRGLSSSYGGCKSRGIVPVYLFDAWAELAGMLKNAKVPAGIRTLLDEAKVAAFVDRIPQMWPEWNVAPKTYTVGQTVKMQFGKTKPVIEGKVEKILGSMVTCRFPGMGLVRCPADMLDGCNA